MESKTESNFLSAKSTNDAVIYRAVGWVAGTYQPSEDELHRGIFITEDGLSIPAQITGQLRGRLKHRRPEYATQPDFFSQSFRWMVYPKTEPMRFALTAMKQLKAEPTNKLGLDEFCVVGLVKSIDSGRVNVRIQRNQPPRQGGKKASFKLTLAGSISDEAIGQIWELKVRRIGENLTIVAGQPYQPSAEDLVWLEQHKMQAAIQSNLSAPIKQQHKSHHQEDTAIAAPKSPAVVPALESLDAPSGLPLASVSASAQTPAQQQQILPKSVQTSAQQKVLPKPESHQERSPVANPMQRVKEALKQQRPSKASSPKSDQQRDQISVGKKQLSPSKTSSKPQQKPAFQVKVNDRVFNGYKSVTLNRRIVCVDGLAIAQTKMAIVIGQPKTMQADGGVTQGNNQAVLLSK